MKLRYINRPVKMPLSLYGEAVEYICEKFNALPGVKSIYRFGNITTPGISDLDLLLVFEDNVRCNQNGLENLPEAYREVFTHSIMALRESHFLPNQYYTLWSRHHLVAGTTGHVQVRLREKEADCALHVQTAVEFLAANYIDLKVQIAYGTVKLRTLLQHMKGISYDLDYLGITDSPLHPFLGQLKEWIQNWFSHTPSDKDITKWLQKWIPEYDRFTFETMRNYPLYLPDAEHYRVAGNQFLHKSSSLEWKRTGILVPDVFSLIGKKYFNLQNKLNRFDFEMPLTSLPSHPILTERFSFLSEMKAYNRRYLPGFMTMTTSITSKLI